MGKSKTMVTAAQCLKKYGNPRDPKVQSRCMITWQVDKDILIAFSHVKFTLVGTIGFPKRIFINKDFLEPLQKALRNVIARGLAKELKTWDGVFVIRKKVSGNSLSLHSWAIACDLNAWENGYNVKPKLSAAFVKCFTDVGLEWGGNWKTPDGMHFQLSKI